MYDRVTLNLNCRDAEEAISKYTRDFMRVTRKTPTLQSNSQALTRKFLNGIRPEPLRRLLKSEAEDFLISSIPEILKRLTDLLPEYHRPYSKHYQLFEDKLANKYSGNPNRRSNNQRSRRTPNRRYVTPNQEPRSTRSNASRSTQPQARTDHSSKFPLSETICNYCKKPGHVVRDCPDPNCKLSQVNKKKPYKNPKNPTHFRTHSTRNKTQSNSIVESIKEGLKEDYSIDETYYSRTVTHSSSSDTEDLAYNVSLNPLSINSDSYSEDTSSPSPNTFLSDSNCYDLDDVFENLDFILPGRDFPSFQDLTYVEPSKPQVAKQKTPSFPARCARNEVLKSSRAATMQDERVSSCEASVVEKETDSSLTSSDSLETDLPQIHDQRKALRDNIHDFSLERASSHLDSDMALLDADCAQRPGPSDKNSSLEESSESSITESANTLVAAKISAPAPACLIIPDKSKISFTLKELNQPMDKNLLHLKIFTKPDHFLYGMVDTGATVSCISEELAEVAKLHIENQTTSLSLADGKLIDVKLAKGRFAFMLGGTAKLTYVTLRLCLLPCPNNFILGCDALKRLGLLTEDFLFINLSTRNLQIQEDESIPDCFLPDSQNVCSHHDLSDTSTAPEFVQALSDDLLKKLPDIEKTSFNLNDTALSVEVKKLLLKFPDIFAKLPAPEGIKCEPMKLEFYDESSIVSKKARFLPPDKLKIANEEIDTLLKNGFAVPYDGLFASPIHLVCAPGKAPRLTGDYSGHKGINDLTIPVPADLPRITDVCAFLSSATYVATLDLPKAFWQLNLRPEDQPKTAIVIPGRKVMFTRAAFGLKNVPAIFQNLMRKIFDCDGVFIYLDDIIVAAENKTDFLNRLEIVKLNKIPIPTSVPELRSFVGAINFVRDWLPAVSTELAPLTELLKGSPRKIHLNQQQIECFQNIKKLISNSVPLELPDDTSQILVSTDASEKGIAGIIWKELSPSEPGACLSERNVAPLSFYSRILTPSQQRWSTLQKELFAIVMTLNQPNLSSFLQTKHLTLFCDHKNLSYLLSCPDSNRVVLRWIPVLQSFSFDCVHVDGPNNHWADYLSRSLPKKEEKPEKKKTKTRSAKASAKVNSLISIEDGKTPFYQVTSYDPEEHYRGLPARLRTASYLEMASYYNPDSRSLPCPCQAGHGFHYCPGEERFCEVVDDKYYTEVGNRNPDTMLTHIKEPVSPIIDKINVSQAVIPIVPIPLICYNAKALLYPPNLIFPFSPIETFFNLHAIDTPPSWYSLNHCDARRLLTATALRSESDPFAILNSLKHFSLLDRRDINNIQNGSSPYHFILSTDICFIYQHVFPLSKSKDPYASVAHMYPDTPIHPKIHNRSIPIADFIQHSNLNNRLYFYDPTLRARSYLPEVIPPNAFFIKLNCFPACVTLGQLINNIDPLHLAPLPLEMIPYTPDHASDISFNLETLFVNDDLYKLTENDILTLPIIEFLRYGILNPSQRSPIPLSRYSLQFYDEIYEEVLYSPFLSSRSWSDADIEHELEMQDLIGDENAGSSIPCYIPLLSLLYNISSEFIPDYLMYPLFVYIYHYCDDGNACPHPVVTYQYSYEEVENSPIPKQLLTPVPRNFYLSSKLNSCNTCPHVDSIHRSLLDEPSLANYIRTTKPLDTIRYNFKISFYDKELQAVVLPRQLPDGTYSKEMHSLVPFPDPDQSIESVCSIVNVTTRSQVPREETEEDTQEVDPEPNTPETTSSDFIDQNSAHSPAEAFLRKIFNEQQKLLDDDELFSNCVIDEKTGLKLTPDKKIILWSDGTQLSQPVDTVKNTVAFQRYSKMMNLDKPRRRGKRKKR
ncbi:hypothetical protein P9112_009748 [Eukaryota sp. TZLM1-RC]